jgi:hypothetical protein
MITHASSYGLTPYLIHLSPCVPAGSVSAFGSTTNKNEAQYSSCPARHIAPDIENNTSSHLGLQSNILQPINLHFMITIFLIKICPPAVN